MEDKSFIMFPNSLVWNHKNTEDTYSNKNIYGEIIVHIFSYLDGMENRLGKTFFTIEHMIIFSGMAVNTRKDKSFDQFKEVLIYLQSKKIIVCDVDFTKIKPKDSITCEFIMPIEKNENGKNTRFFNITHENYLDIMDRYEGKLSKLTLLRFYYYINARISRRETQIIDGKVICNDIVFNGGKANCFYDKYSVICDELKIAENTWTSYTQELKKLELIFYDNIGKVKKNDNKHIANNVYCVDVCELKEALNQSELYYISHGYTISGKKTDEETSIINGTKGKIQQEKNMNKDTTKLESKLEKLESNKSKKNNDNDMFKIKSLLEKHEGEILSSIWDEFNDKTAESWYEIEVSLGLIDSDSNDLLVDYGEYKWVVMNYDESKHDYYVNCVKKHIAENKKPKGKGLFGVVKKHIEKVEETSHDCDPYNLEPKEPNYEFMYEDNEESCDENDYPDDDENDYNEMMRN